MALTTLFLTVGTTEPGTGGGVVFDLAEAQGSSAQHAAETNGFSEALRYQAVIDGLDATLVSTSIRIAAQGGSTEIRWRLQQIDTDGVTVLANSGYSPVVSAVGTHTADLTLDTTWSAGQLLAISVEGNHSGGGGRSMQIAVGDADSWIEPDIAAAVVEETVSEGSTGAVAPGDEITAGEALSEAGPGAVEAIDAQIQSASIEEVGEGGVVVAQEAVIPLTISESGGGFSTLGVQQEGAAPKITIHRPVGV